MSSQNVSLSKGCIWVPALNSVEWEGGLWLTHTGLEVFWESFSFLFSCLAFSLASAFSSFLASTVCRDRNHGKKEKKQQNTKPQKMTELQTNDSKELHCVVRTQSLKTSRALSIPNLGLLWTTELNVLSAQPRLNIPWPDCVWSSRCLGHHW